MIYSNQNVFGFGAIYASINGYKRAAQVFHWNQLVHRLPHSESASSQ